MSGQELSPLAGIYGDQAAPNSKALPAQIKLITQLLQTHFMDAGQVVISSELDGVHWDADQHECFAKAVREKIQAIIPLEQ